MNKQLKLQWLHNYKKTIIFVAIGIISIFGLLISNSPTRETLRSTYIIYQNHIYNGLGKEVKLPLSHLYEPQKNDVDPWSSIYIWDIDSGGNLLIYKRSWELWPYGSRDYSNTRNYVNEWAISSVELFKYNWNTNTVSPIIKFDDDVFIDSLNKCTFSPNSKKAVCLQRQDLLVFDLNKGEVIFRDKDDTDHMRGSERVSWLSNDVVIENTWGDSKYKKNIIRINIKDGSVTEVCNYRDGSGTNKYFGLSLRSKLFEGENPCGESPEVAVLFGGLERPVAFLFPSTGPLGDRFYFYENGREGGGYYWGKSWIEGYDRKTRRTFRVKWLENFWTMIAEMFEPMVPLPDRTGL